MMEGISMHHSKQFKIKILQKCFKSDSGCFTKVRHASLFCNVEKTKERKRFLLFFSSLLHFEDSNSTKNKRKPAITRPSLDGPLERTANEWGHRAWLPVWLEHGQDLGCWWCW